MYQLYIANKNYSSWSLRPWILLKQLGIPFEEKQVIFNQAINWETFRKFSPSGTVPCLFDSNIKVWDSLSIVEYLADKHDDIWPKESTTKAWARSAAAEMHAGFSELREICSMNCGIRVKLIEFSPKLLKDISRIDELWQDGLNKFGGPFLCGNQFTAVDAFYSPVTFRVQSFDIKLSAISNQYKDEILALQAMQDWYHAALNEPWIDDSHEEDYLKYGELTHDYRTVNN